MTRFAPALAALAALLQLALGGCSHSYEKVPLNLTAQGSRPLAIGVHDERPYIHPSGKPPAFVGVQYSLGGVPFDVTTASGRPMADDWSAAISSALRARGFDTRLVPVSNSMERSTVVRDLIAGGSRALLVSVKDWNVDARQAADLAYQLDAQVLDEKGEVIGQSGLGGKDHLGADFINGATFARDQSLASFKAKMEQLLNDPKIVDALR